MSKGFQYLQQLWQDLRKRFHREYLSQLVQRLKVEKSANVKEGDVVISGSEWKKRMEWPMARVLKIYPG